MTSNISYLYECEPFNRGYVSFDHGREKNTCKGSIKTGKLEFENVYFVEELKYNMFSVSQIYDNKNSVLFTDTECLVLGKDFKLVDDKHVLLRTPRQQNMYTIDLKNVVPYKNLTCLIAKASVDESMLWHRRLGHLNIKTMNKLVRSNLVKGLPSKSFENNHSCVACLKGKQHKASYDNVADLLTKAFDVGRFQYLVKEDGIFLSQDKYVGDIFKKFGYSDVRSSNTPMDKENPWGKDDVDLYLYRSMIRSLMYLTASRPDIMFTVCACARHQVIPKECHLHAVKRIFRYLKGHPKLGLWYPKDSPFDLVAYSDSDYGGASQDRKSTSGGCQFLGRRLISWQCKKQTIVATSTTEAEYVTAASCCRQVLWIQNQLLDYGHHFIRDCFEKKLINVDHIHTDENVLDLLTKPFDAGRFQVSMSCETLSKEISTSIHRLLHTAKTLELVWIWLGGDYGNNADFHPIVDFIKASLLRYALTFKPTICVSYIRQFWSTARIKTTAEGTQIPATVDGVLRTITESSLRRNLKLQDEEGIISLPDTELFENLTLMGYNISPNQKFTFQK
nr:putative ribonuclease H-like domain-containing protein [Tanacetum cinerariifolium]